MLLDMLLLLRATADACRAPARSAAAAAAAWNCCCCYWDRPASDLALPLANDLLLLCT
jgi:hypothetical protein